MLPGGALLIRAAYVLNLGLLPSQVDATESLEKTPTQAEP